MTQSDPIQLQEVKLFDTWVLERRAGLTPDIDKLAEELPEERRAAFKQMLRATAALQLLAGVSPVRPVEPVSAPHVVEEKTAEGR